MRRDVLAWQRDALHIWPRGNYMLIALPNQDGSFTATLFLPKHGTQSFESLTRDAAIDAFLSRNFPDARVIDAQWRLRSSSIIRSDSSVRCTPALAFQGHGGADRRLGARHRAVSRPGHELLLRGLRRIRCLPGPP